MTRTPNSSLTNALRILKSFSIDHPEWTLSEISEAVGVSKSTACRLVQTLESEGFMFQIEPFNTYRLGASVLALSHTVAGQFAMFKDTAPYLKQLTELTGESSHIAVLDQAEVIYIQKEDGRHRIPLRSHIGRRNPAHCTASGQAILAYMEPAYVEKLYASGLASFTSRTIVSLEKLQHALAAVRQQGYSISNGEFLAHIVSVGAPIFNKRGQVFASISVAGLNKRMLPNLPRIVSRVRRTSEAIAESIGARSKEVDV